MDHVEILTDRILWAVAGCVVGFILGYITKGVRDAKMEAHEAHVLAQQLEREVHRPETPDIAKERQPNGRRGTAEA